MRSSSILGADAALLITPASVAAQDQGRVGVTTGYPASIGLLWHVTNTVALRPEFSFSAGTTSLQGIFRDSESTTRSLGLAISVLWTLDETEGFATYFAPRVTYSRLSSTLRYKSETPILIPGLVEVSGVSLDLPRLLNEDESRWGVGGGGTVGARYSVHRRFSVFGEVGISYNRAGGRIDIKSSSLATTGGAGVVIYFK